jgi:hypothetical protein
MIGDIKIGGFGRQLSSFNRRTTPGIFLYGLRKNRETSVKIAGVLTVIQTEDLPNTSLNCYRYNSLHGF